MWQHHKDHSHHPLEREIFPVFFICSVWADWMWEKGAENDWKWVGRGSFKGHIKLDLGAGMTPNLLCLLQILDLRSVWVTLAFYPTDSCMGQQTLRRLWCSYQWSFFLSRMTFIGPSKEHSQPCSIRCWFWSAPCFVLFSLGKPALDWCLFYPMVCCMHGLNGMPSWSK